MFIKNLKLTNFRNYPSLELSFNKRFNLIIGPNAQGKTNLLEALYFLGFLKSFRTSNRDELIKKDSEPHHAILEGNLEREEIEHHILISIENQKRSVKLNHKKPELFKDYYGLIPILLFEPSDVYLWRESPSKRRKYLDRALFLIYPDIIHKQFQYEKVLQQKNKLLKEASSSIILDQLPLWNEQLATLAAAIVSRRIDWVQKMNLWTSCEYQSVSGVNSELKLEYISKAHQLDGGANGSSPSSDENEIKIFYQEQLQKLIPQEIRRRESLIGPHRDDFVALLNNRDISSFGSQGENRSSIIALKSAQIRIFNEDKGFSPLFLLDDVLSELDSSRIEALFSYLKETHGQVFFTTTDGHLLPSFIREQSHSFLVEEGSISMLA